jgi:hypothetical protein
VALAASVENYDDTNIDQVFSLLETASGFRGHSEREFSIGVGYRFYA